MILTDREILAALEHGIISLAPRPDQAAINSTSVDLTLDQDARVWRRQRLAGVDQQFSPAAPGFSFQSVVEEYCDQVSIGTDEDGVVLEPRDFLLAFTRERLTIPISAKLAARVEGKSSLARLGIGVHVTAPTIHAGFDGRIQLEVCNLGPLKVKLTAGMRVCQLVFEQTLGTPSAGYSGQFQGQ